MNPSSLDRIRSAIKLVRATQRDLHVSELGPELSAALHTLAGEVAHLAQRTNQPARSAAAEPTHAPAQRARVLLVDDETDMLDGLATLLEPEFEVITATDALVGLGHIRAHPVDAVVTDLQMPGIDGLALLRLLRSDPKTGELPCLILTAHGADKLEAFGLGADDYLMKPIDLHELRARLQRRISEARRLQEERRVQQTDALTGLANRRAFQTRLAELLGAADAKDHPVSVALLDADGLKTINDTWGHPVGDRALEAIGAALRRSTRAADCTARLGGDEFAILMPETDAEEAARILARIEEDISHAPLHVGEHVIPLGLSAGYSSLREDDDAAKLMQRADQALYANKRRRQARALRNRGHEEQRRRTE